MYLHLLKSVTFSRPLQKLKYSLLFKQSILHEEKGTITGNFVLKKIRVNKENVQVNLSYQINLFIKEIVARIWIILTSV